MGRRERVLKGEGEIELSKGEERERVLKWVGERERVLKGEGEREFLKGRKRDNYQRGRQ